MHWNKFGAQGFEQMLAMGCRFKSLFSTQKFPRPDTKPVPSPTDPSIELARRKERQAIKRRGGRKSTILTSPLGDTSTEAPAASNLGGS